MLGERPRDRVERLLVVAAAGVGPLVALQVDDAQAALPGDRQGGAERPAEAEVTATGQRHTTHAVGIEGIDHDRQRLLQVPVVLNGGDAGRRVLAQPDGEVVLATETGGAGTARVGIRDRAGLCLDGDLAVADPPVAEQPPEGTGDRRDDTRGQADRQVPLRRSHEMPEPAVEEVPVQLTALTETVLLQLLQRLAGGFQQPVGSRHIDGLLRSPTPAEQVIGRSIVG